MASNDLRKTLSFASPENLGPLILWKWLSLKLVIHTDRGWRISPNEGSCPLIKNQTWHVASLILTPTVGILQKSPKSGWHRFWVFASLFMARWGNFVPGIWVMLRKNKYGLKKFIYATTRVLFFGTFPLNENRHVSYVPIPKSYWDLRLKSKRRDSDQQDAESQRCVYIVCYFNQNLKLVGVTRKYAFITPKQTLRFVSCKVHANYPSQQTFTLSCVITARLFQLSDDNFAPQITMTALIDALWGSSWRVMIDTDNLFYRPVTPNLLEVIY